MNYIKMILKYLIMKNKIYFLYNKIYLCSKSWL